MESTLFPDVLEFVNETFDGMTLIDRLNALHKLYIIDDPQDWKDLRVKRNHLAHEYPDKPDKTAQYLNEAFEMALKLLEILDRLENFVQNERAKGM